MKKNKYDSTKKTIDKYIIDKMISMINEMSPEQYKIFLAHTLVSGLKVNVFDYPADIWPPLTPARYYINEFLMLYRKHVKGICVEFSPPVYRDYLIKNKRIKQYEVWNITAHEGVTVVADLQDAKSVEDNRFDSIICTHVLSAIPHPEKAISEIRRVLKPGGLILCTVPCILQKYAPDPVDCWRFTIDSLKNLFRDFKKTKYHSYGNAATVAGSPYYLMTSHFPDSIMSYNDPTCPSILAVAAWK